MISPGPAGPSGAPGTAGTAGFGPAFDALLAALPPDAARAVMAGAVPHWVDAPLMARLLEAPGDGTAALAAVEALRAVHRDPDGRTRYHDEARAHLVARWRREDPAGWRAAHGRALAHFEAARSTGEAEEASLWLEALYHRLIADEPAGLRDLEARFEDALWHHRLGLAERIVAVAEEAKPDLGDGARRRVALLGARLDARLGRGDGGSAVLESLAADAPEGATRADAARALGAAALARHAWSEAVAHAVASRRAATSAADAGFDAPARALADARAMRLLGEVYVDLAARSGGLRRAPLRVGGDARGALDLLATLPFRAYEVLVRRLAALPAWWGWFPDADYQDWTLAELLRIARGWFARAAAPLAAQDPRAAVELALARARVDRMMRRAARAEGALGALAADALVADSPYWRARIALERLAAGALLGRVGPAERGATAAARDALRRARDEAAAGRAAHLLGDLAAGAGRPAEAAEAWRDAARSAEAVGDVLARTSALLAAAGAASPRDGASGAAAGGMADAGAHGAPSEGDVRAYVMRFPDGLLRRFRRIALGLALPPAVAFGALALVAVVPLVWVVEGEALIAARGLAAETTLRDYAALTAFALAPLIGSIWVFRAVFGLVGTWTVRRLARDVDGLARETPALVVTRAADVARVSAAGTTALPWAEVRRRIDLGLGLGARPSALFARTVLEAGDGRALVVEGITSDFAAVRADIAARLRAAGAAPALGELRLALLDWRWLAAVAVAALLIALRATASGALVGVTTELMVDGAPIELALPQTARAIAFLPTLFVLFMALSHLRLVAFDRRARAAAGDRGALLPRAGLRIAAAAWVAVAVAWLAFVARP